MTDIKTPPDMPGNVLTPISREMQESYLTYAMSVIMARALPDVRDGLKPSQRRILVAMNDLNLGPTAAHRKCAKICGDTSGNYHPHGEGVIYPTLVRLGQEWNMRYPLIHAQGNFGSIDGDPPAAMRYTECRLARPAQEMLADIDKETVDFVENYDGTRTEPVVLPGRFPNLLVNGAEGIAVGMATRILPHNLGEICEAVVAVIENPQITTDELIEIVAGPDFPTGGVILGTRGIREAYETGRGSIAVQGKLHTEQVRGHTQIVVDEIPHGVMLPTIKDRIVDAVEQGTIKGIADLRDESGRRSPVRLVILLKKDADPDLVTNQLYQYTPLRSNINAMNIVLVNRVPRTLNLKQLIEAFVDHRRNVIRRRTQYLLRKARQRAHVLEGLILAVADIDEIIRIIRQSPDADTARQRLMDRALRLSEQATLRRLLPEVFVRRATSEDQHLTHTQANAILAMQLRRLTGLEIEQLAQEYSKLVEQISDYELILSEERRVLDIIVEDMNELREKYADERRTEISQQEATRFEAEDLIAPEDVVVTISHQGFIKRVPIDAYRRQGRGGRGVRGTDSRDDDFIEVMRIANTHDYLLVFTNRGRVYWIRVFDIPSMSRVSRGRSLANLLTFREGERQMAVLPVSQFEESFVFFATLKGVVKKTPVSAFSHPRATGIIAITLDEDDALIGARLTTGEHEIVLGTRNGMACRFNEPDVRAMGRTARGVRGIALRGDDQVVDMSAVEPGMSLLTVCERGFGKRTDVSAYRLTRRGGKGVINVKVTKRNGRVVALRAVSDDDELMLITGRGTLLRMRLTQVREIGRATQGVRLIRVEDDDRVVAVAHVVKERDEEEAVDQETAPEPTPSSDDEPQQSVGDEQAPDEGDQPV